MREEGMKGALLGNRRLVIDMTCGAWQMTMDETHDERVTP